jgi:hypothetical protein
MAVGKGPTIAYPRFLRIRSGRRHRFAATTSAVISLALALTAVEASAVPMSSLPTVSPSSGGHRTIFTVSFRSPIDLRNQGRRYPFIVYDVFVRHSVACNRPGGSPRDNWKAFLPAPHVRRGVLITRRIGGGSAGWCVGAHDIGVSIVQRRTSGICRHVIGPPFDCIDVRLIGKVSFTIVGQPNWSGGL